MDRIILQKEKTLEKIHMMCGVDNYIDAIHLKHEAWNLWKVKIYPENYLKYLFCKDWVNLTKFLKLQLKGEY